MMNPSDLEKDVSKLIGQQKDDWELPKTNYADLQEVESRTLAFDEFQITLQFNPGRVRSSNAKTDTQSIQARPCFLCAANRPAKQQGIDFLGKYTILINPYPIFPNHLTVALNQHLPQTLEPYLADMLELSKNLPRFTIFYNGPKCGASAPDHFHFQAADKHLLPANLETDRLSGKIGDRLLQNETTTIWAIGSTYLRNVLLFHSNSASQLHRLLQATIDTLKERGQEGEPMLNLLVAFENGHWQALLFPRDRQRPRQFFADDDSRILISPASVEMAGLVVLPRKEDFDQLTRDDLADIYRQVSINDHDFDELKQKLKQRLNNI